jgi:hypothetical protein
MVVGMFRGLMLMTVVVVVVVIVVVGIVILVVMAVMAKICAMALTLTCRLPFVILHWTLGLQMAVIRAMGAYSH